MGLGAGKPVLTQIGDRVTAADTAGIDPLHPFNVTHDRLARLCRFQCSVFG